MAQPRVLLAESRRVETRPAESGDQAWRWLAWFSALLAAVGLSDFALAWFPLRFGVPEWEFATVAQTIAGLPLPTIGLAGMLGSAMVLDRRRLMMTLAIVFALLALAVFVALGLFLLDVPLALNAGQGAASIGIKKAIVKTLLLGILFGGAYAAAAVAIVRRLGRRARL